MADAQQKYKQWQQILLDEKANTMSALPLTKADMRLDFYYGGDHTFSHATDMIQAKLKLLENEISIYLPSLAEQLNLNSNY